MSTPPHFLTKRLCLRPFRPSDLSHLERYVVREHFWKYLPIDPQTPESVRVFLDKRLADRWGDGSYLCAIELAELGHLIGTVRISVDSATHRSGDIGYALNDEYSGRGYMTEAVRRILNVGFNELGLNRIWAMADTDNEPSWQLLERVGMLREGLLRQNQLVRSNLRDSFLYSILESDSDKIKETEGI